MVIIRILLFLIVPELLGLLLTRFMKEKNSIFWAYVVGYIIEFASFEVIYLPAYFLGASFNIMKNIWLIFVLLLAILSVYLNIKQFKEFLMSTKETISKMPKFLTVVCIILLAIQIYFPVRYMQIIDPDDAFYLSTVTTTLETNSLFKYNAYNGFENTQNMLRYSMSGLSIWYAVVCDILNIHPAIFQHTIWPAVVIPLEIIIYALIGNKLFNYDKKKTMLFLFLLQIIYMFGLISIFTNFSFFAYRSWQGKSLIANLIIPATWLFYLYCIENDKKIVYWLVFLMVMISSCFVTEMGVFLVPISVGILSLITLIQERKILKFVKSIACCLPQIIVGCIYLIFK